MSDVYKKKDLVGSRYGMLTVIEDYADDKVEEGKQLCTLVTCTPSGSTSHRLFVLGVRIK